MPQSNLLRILICTKTNYGKCICNLLPSSSTLTNNIRQKSFLVIRGGGRGGREGSNAPPHLLKISPKDCFSPSHQCFCFSFSGLGIRSTKGKRRGGKKQDKSFYILPNAHRLTKSTKRVVFKPWNKTNKMQWRQHKTWKIFFFFCFLFFFLSFLFLSRLYFT